MAPEGVTKLDFFIHYFAKSRYYFVIEYGDAISENYVILVVFEEVINCDDYVRFVYFCVAVFYVTCK